MFVLFASGERIAPLLIVIVLLCSVVSCRIMATVDRDGFVEDDRFTSFASPQDQVVGIRGCLRNIPVIKGRIVPGFQYLKPFGDQERRELPEFFEFAVGVDNERDVLTRMMRGDSEIGCHNVFPPYADFCIARTFRLDRLCLPQLPSQSRPKTA